jgi:hypothetical protein
MAFHVLEEAVRFSKLVADAIDEYVQISGKEKLRETARQSEELLEHTNNWRQAEKWN